MTDTQKTIHFIAGMPRSGSTLLANILAQNPRFHATGTSGIMDVMFGVRNNWNNLIEFKATPNPAGELRVLKAILNGYYSDIEKPIIFDKCRGWTSLLDMAEAVLERKAKVLVPVRDMRDVLASFEKLWRKESALNQIGQEGQNYFDFQTVEGRMNVWMRGDQPVGLAYNRIVDALHRGFADRMLLIDFDEMTRNPEAVFKKIYEFLEEPYFKHNFDHVEQVTWEDDSVHGFHGLHDIRSKVEPVPSYWKKVLGDKAEAYGNLNFWKNK